MANEPKQLPHEQAIDEYYSRDADVDTIMDLLDEHHGDAHKFAKEKVLRNPKTKKLQYDILNTVKGQKDFGDALMEFYRDKIYDALDIDKKVLKLSDARKYKLINDWYGINKPMVESLVSQGKAGLKPKLYREQFKKQMEDLEESLQPYKSEHIRPEHINGIFKKIGAAKYIGDKTPLGRKEYIPNVAKLLEKWQKGQNEIELSDLENTIMRGYLKPEYQPKEEVQDKKAA